MSLRGKEEFRGEALSLALRIIAGIANSRECSRFHILFYDSIPSFDELQSGFKTEACEYLFENLNLIWRMT